MNRTFYDLFGKRWFDASFALLGLLVTFPILLLTAFLVRLTSPGPVLFRQTRTGRLGIPFLIFKFRTMIWHKVASGHRITANELELAPAVVRD